MASDRTEHPCGGRRYAFPPYDNARGDERVGGAEMCRYLCLQGEDRGGGGWKMKR